jgi:hypothetical protein
MIIRKRDEMRSLFLNQIQMINNDFLSACSPLFFVLTSFSDFVIEIISMVFVTYSFIVFKASFQICEILVFSLNYGYGV